MFSALRVVFVFLLLLTASRSLADNLKITPPEEVGYSSEKLMALKDMLDPYIEGGKLPNYLLSIFHEDKKIFEIMNGTTDFEFKKPIRNDDIFWIASMAKPITSLAALQLVERGELDLNDPIDKYLPYFSNPLVAVDGNMASELKPTNNKILVKNLLTHTSGLTYGSTIAKENDVSNLYDDINPMSPLRTLSDTVSLISELPLIAEPNTEFNYSVGVLVLGLIIEDITGMRLGDYLEANIFMPLGMKDTAFDIEASKHDRVAALFQAKRVTVQVPGENLSYEPSPLTEWCKNKKMADHGGEGLCSTAADYHKFIQLLMNKGELNGTRILSEEYTNLMLTNQMPAEAGEAPLTNFFGPVAKNLQFSYGIGISLHEETKLPRYYWWAGAANTFFWFDTKTRLNGVFMTHHFPVLYNIIDQLYKVTEQSKL